MGREEYMRDEALKKKRRHELGSLEYQCRNCAKKKCHFLKIARTHFDACKDYLPLKDNK